MGMTIDCATGNSFNTQDLPPPVITLDPFASIDAVIAQRKTALAVLLSPVSGLSLTNRQALAVLFGASSPQI